MIDQDVERQAAIFSALADVTRLKLIRLLYQQQDGRALCVNALAALLGVTQSAVSQHLRVLKAIGLLKSERRGYYIHYSINKEALERCREQTVETLSLSSTRSEENCEDYSPAKGETGASQE